MGSGRDKEEACLTSCYTELLLCSIFLTELGILRKHVSYGKQSALTFIGAIRAVKIPYGNKPAREDKVQFMEEGIPLALACNVKKV